MGSLAVIFYFYKGKPHFHFHHDVGDRPRPRRFGEGESPQKPVFLCASSGLPRGDGLLLKSVAVLLKDVSCVM